MAIPRVLAGFCCGSIIWQCISFWDVQHLIMAIMTIYILIIAIIDAGEADITFPFPRLSNKEAEQFADHLYNDTNEPEGPAPF